MRLEMSLKPSDIILLKVLSSVLIVVVTLSFFIMPLMETRSQLIAQREETASERQQVEDEILSISSLESRIETSTDRLAAATEEYYGKMDNNEIDKLVTNLAIKHNLFPAALDIGEETAGGPVAYGDEETEEQQSEVEQLEEEAEADSTIASDDEETTSVEKLIGDPYVSKIHYVSTVKASLTLQGSEDDFYSFLDDIAKNYPSMQVSSIDTDAQTYLDENWNTVEQMTIHCTISIYICGNEEEAGENS